MKVIEKLRIITEAERRNAQRICKHEAETKKASCKNGSGSKGEKK